MGRDEYEAYLDSLDDKLFLDRRGFIRCNFGNGYTVSVSACRTREAIKFHARAMLYAILGEDGLHYQYLVERFVRLSSKFHKIKYDFAPYCRSLGVSVLKDNALPRYEGLSEISPPVASLCFEREKPSPQYSQLSFKRRMEGQTPTVVVVKPFPGFPNEVFSVIATGISVVVSPSFICIEIEPKDRWEPSRDIPQSEINFVENHTRNGSIFLLRPSAYGGDAGPVVLALETLFEGLKFSCSNRTSENA